MNEAKALQQISTLELSLEAQPGARAKLFVKLHTSYFCDPVRRRVNLLHYLVLGQLDYELNKLINVYLATSTNRITFCDISAYFNAVFYHSLMLTVLCQITPYKQLY